MRVLVFDLGGTRLRAALFDGERSVRRQEEATADLRGRSDAADALVDQLSDLGSRVLGAEAPAAAVGVAFPGPVDRAGRVQAAPTVWGDALAEPFDLGGALAPRFADAPVRVVNDLTAAGYRYATDEVFCLVTVSTGIGHKVFHGGAPLLGEQHRGGEIGHWRFDDSPEAPPCDCGGRGHVGALSSGRATAYWLERLGRESPDLARASKLSAGTEPSVNERLAVAFQAGDPFARLVVERGAEALGAALALLHVGVGLERYVIIGGFARALGPGYLDVLAAAAARRAWGDPGLWRGRLEPGADDDDSGVVGMARCLERTVGSG